MDRLLSLKEAAARLAVHENTMRTYVKAAIVRARKIGGQWKIEPEDLKTCGRINGYRENQAQNR